MTDEALIEQETECAVNELRAMIDFSPEGERVLRTVIRASLYRVLNRTAEDEPLR